jgi:hypothetical protein
MIEGDIMRGDKAGDQNNFDRPALWLPPWLILPFLMLNIILWVLGKLIPIPGSKADILRSSRIVKF